MIKILKDYAPFDNDHIIWQEGDHRIKMFIDSFPYPDNEIDNKEDDVYGLVVEKWNPEIDKGWEHLDSIWGVEYSYIEGAVEDYFSYIWE